MNKYTVLSRFAKFPHHNSFRVGDRVTDLFKDGQAIATFYGDYPNNETNAQKVCDLLNEVSRSQGGA